MFKVKLTKIESSHKNLRTDIVEGLTESMPVVDQDFVMFAEALEPGGTIRYIRTSPVKEVTEDRNGLSFKTNNSSYRLELI